MSGHETILNEANPIDWVKIDEKAIEIISSC